MSRVLQKSIVRYLLYCDIASKRFHNIYFIDLHDFKNYILNIITFLEYLKVLQVGKKARTFLKIACTGQLEKVVNFHCSWLDSVITLHFGLLGFFWITLYDFVKYLPLSISHSRGDIQTTIANFSKCSKQCFLRRPWDRLLMHVHFWRSSEKACHRTLSSLYP